MAKVTKSEDLVLVKICSTLKNCEVVKKNFEFSRENALFDQLIASVSSGFDLNGQKFSLYEFPDGAEPLNSPKFQKLLKAMGKVRSITFRLVIHNPPDAPPEGSLDLYTTQPYHCNTCSRILDSNSHKCYCISCCNTETLCEKCQVIDHDGHDYIRVSVDKQLSELVKQLNIYSKQMEKMGSYHIEDDEKRRMKRKFPDYDSLTPEQQDALKHLYLEMEIDDVEVFDCVRKSKLREKSKIIGSALSLWQTKE